MKTVTMTELRKNLFQLVDQAIATGEPLVFDRKGTRVTIQGGGRMGHENTRGRGRTLAEVLG